jgi:NitT/TauT family transport system substrate-binding protein
MFKETRLMRLRRSWIVGAILASLVMLLVLIQWGLPPRNSGGTPEEEPMTFLSTFGIDAKLIPFYVALDRGYFEAEGVSPTLLEGRGSSFAMTALDSGTADMAIVDWTTLVSHVQNGAKAKAVMVITEKPLLGIVTLEDRGIKHLEDLENRTIGEARGGALRSLLSVAMSMQGADSDRVTYLNVDDSIMMLGLMKREYDASTLYYPELYLWEEFARMHGEQLAVMLLGDHLDLYGHVVAVSTSFLQQKPHVVRGFLRAFTKGLEEVMNDQQTTVEHLLSHHPELDPADMIPETRLTLELMDRDAILRGEVGFDKDYAERSIATIAATLGTPIDRPALDFYTNEYLDTNE